MPFLFFFWAFLRVGDGGRTKIGPGTGHAVGRAGVDRPCTCARAGGRVEGIEERSRLVNFHACRNKLEIA